MTTKVIIETEYVLWESVQSVSQSTGESGGGGVYSFIHLTKGRTQSHV